MSNCQSNHQPKLPSRQQLLRDNQELRAKLQEAEETLRAIREGEVDAIVVSSSKGERVFSLTETENLHRRMVETMSEAALATSPEGVILFCNHQICALLQRTQSQLLGHPLNEFVAPQDRERLARLLDTAGTQTADDRMLLIGSNGALVPMHLWASYLERLEGPMICLVGTDLSQMEADQDLIHQLKEQQNELHKLNRILRALSNSNQALMRVADETTLLQEVCRIIVQDCGHPLVWIGFADQDEAKTVRPVAYSGFEAGYLESLHLTWADTERGQGPTGTAIRTARPCRCQDILTDPQYLPWQEEALRHKYASSIALPLLSDGKVWGALNIYASEPQAFSEDEVRLLTELAGDLAQGLATLRLRAAKEQSENELRQAKDQLEHKVRERTSELAFTVSTLQQEAHQRQQAEQQLRAAHEQLLQRANQLRALASELTLTEQHERQRIAKILHDHLQQLLVATKYRVSILKPENLKRIRQDILELEKLLDQTIQVSRSLTAELSPPILREGTLIEGLGWLARWMAEKHDLKVAVVKEDGLPPLKEDLKILLFESVRELLFNTVKHAQVKAAAVEIHQPLPTELQLTVRDAGQGFAPDRLTLARAKGGGFGLFSIRERLELLGGKLEIQSAPGQGSRFVMTVPLAPTTLAPPTTEPIQPAALD